jgi:hypothetical protein
VSSTRRGVSNRFHQTSGTEQGPLFGPDTSPPSTACARARGAGGEVSTSRPRGEGRQRVIRRLATVRYNRREVASSSREGQRHSAHRVELNACAHAILTVKRRPDSPRHRPRLQPRRERIGTCWRVAHCIKRRLHSRASARRPAVQGPADESLDALQLRARTILNLECRSDGERRQHLLIRR